MNLRAGSLGRGGAEMHLPGRGRLHGDDSTFGRSDGIIEVGGTEQVLQRGRASKMRVVASDEDEARGLATANMPNESKLEALDGTWSITRTMDGVWTVYIEGAADKAREMGHIEPHADIQWYESGEMAADAVSRGHHTAYGAAITEQKVTDA